MDEQELFGHQSQWRPWAIGIVAKDKPFGTDEIALTSIERLPEQTGSVNEEKREYESTIESPLGGTSAQKLVGSGLMTASWAPMGQNHLLTSPMVRANEQVQLWKYADQDKLFWNTVFCEPGIRRTERIIMGAGNLSTPLEGVIGVENSYYIDFDTLSKKLTIGTTQSDGEAYGYTVVLNPSQNSVSISDNIGNVINIDSPSNNVSLTDASGGVFETRDGHPRIYGPKGVDIETPALVDVKGETTMHDDVSMKSSLMITKNLSSGAGGGGTASFGGDTTVEGSMNISGSLSVSGYANFSGGHGPH